MSFEDNQVIGWIGNTVSAGEPSVGVIDPNHVIVSSLYCTALEGPCTYLITLEQIKIDPIKNVVYQLKERAQSSVE